MKYGETLRQRSIPQWGPCKSLPFVSCIRAYDVAPLIIQRMPQTTLTTTKSSISSKSTPPLATARPFPSPGSRMSIAAISKISCSKFSRKSTVASISLYEASPARLSVVCVCLPRAFSDRFACRANCFPRPCHETDKPIHPPRACHLPERPQNI